MRDDSMNPMDFILLIVSVAGGRNVSSRSGLEFERNRPGDSLDSGWSLAFLDAMVTSPELVAPP